jgi:hypothetical protein
MNVCVYVFFIFILHAPLLWSNTTCILTLFPYVYILSSTIFLITWWLNYFEVVIDLYNLSKGILFVIFVKFLLNLLIISLLLTGQFSDLISAAFRPSPSRSSSLQSNNMWLLFILRFYRSTLDWTVKDFVFVQICFNITMPCYHCCKVWGYIKFQFEPICYFGKKIIL